MLLFLDIFLTIFHTGLTLFNLVGWIWKSTRKAHLLSVIITLLSWLLIGWYVGRIGYCFLTDWHWDIKRALGERVGGSFNKYMLDLIFGSDLNATLVDWITGVGLAIVIIASVYVNLRDRFFSPPQNLH